MQTGSSGTYSKKVEVGGRIVSALVLVLPAVSDRGTGTGSGTSQTTVVDRLPFL